MHLLCCIKEVSSFHCFFVLLNNQHPYGEELNVSCTHKISLPYLLLAIWLNDFNKLNVKISIFYL